MPNTNRKKGKKNRKFGRNKNKCAAYSSSRRWEKNKARRLVKHLKNHPDDLPATKALTKVQ